MFSERKEKEFLKKYPFLKDRDIDGSVNVPISMIPLEIPVGWHKLFFQMCDDIKPILEKEGYLENFFFLQVKEKYNRLTCYGSRYTPVAVKQLFGKYEHLARYVCVKCGKPATCETTGYLASYCDDCWKDEAGHESVECLKFKPYFVINSETEGCHCDEKHISFQSEWDRYLKTIEKE